MEPIDSIPPQEKQAEQAVLGAILLFGQEALDEIQGILPLGSFYTEEFNKIYATIQGLSRSGTIIDLLTVHKELPEIEPSKLATIQAWGISVDHAKTHALMVRNAYLKRVLDHFGRDLIREAVSTNEPQTLINESVQKLFNIVDGNSTSETQHIGNLIMPVANEIESYQGKNGIIGISSGFSDLDTITGGFQDDQYIILAARPSMGKTTFVLNLAKRISAHTPVYFFSLEMSSKSLTKKVISIETGINGTILRNPKEFTVERIMQKSNDISKLKLYINDRPGQKVSDIAAEVRRLRRKYGKGIIMIDYAQLLKPESDKYSNGHEKYSTISHDLKSLNKSCGMPLIALAQLNRAVESRQDKEPGLSDLKETGAFEEDADLVAFLHRPDYYEKEKTDPSVTNLLIKKHRNGPLGDIEFLFNKGESKFMDLDNRH